MSLSVFLEDKLLDGPFYISKDILSNLSDKKNIGLIIFIYHVL